MTGNEKSTFFAIGILFLWLLVQQFSRQTICFFFGRQNFLRLIPFSLMPKLSTKTMILPRTHFTDTHTYTQTQQFRIFFYFIWYFYIYLVLAPRRPLRRRRVKVMLRYPQITDFLFHLLLEPFTNCGTSPFCTEKHLDTPWFVVFPGLSVQLHNFTHQAEQLLSGAHRTPHCPMDEWNGN
jgi:hypothetical protein